jgi:hypothetical protein
MRQMVVLYEAYHDARSLERKVKAYYYFSMATMNTQTLLNVTFIDTWPVLLYL